MNRVTKKSKGKDGKMLDMKDKGSYMQPFSCFYDAKSMSAPLSQARVEAIELKIFKEVENQMK